MIGLIPAVWREIFALFVSDIGPVAEFPRFEYSMNDVRRAGEALAGELIWTDDTAEYIRQVFRIAHNYRDSHAFPMRKLRYEVGGQMRKRRLKGGLTVARLKRMPSIRRKLRTISSQLNQIQDLAGCRAILPSIEDVNSLIEAMRENSVHILHREDRYVTNPNLTVTEATTWSSSSKGPVTRKFTTTGVSNYRSGPDFSTLGQRP